jgi:hypothetical protein
LVASLRTNSAYAQAQVSILNCVKTIAESGETVENAIEAGTHDSQVRVTRTRYTFRPQQGQTDLFFWDARIGSFETADNPQLSLPPNSLTPTVYGENGEVLTLTGGNNNQWEDANQVRFLFSNNSATDFEVLVLYQPNGDFTDIFRVGVYPQEQQANGNIGMSLTCLDSAAPALVGGPTF